MHRNRSLEEEGLGTKDDDYPELASGPEILNFSLSSSAHASLTFSCADKLLGLLADQIICEQELAIAYPCLGCRGGLSLFLTYLGLSIQTDMPGRALQPVLIYPGSAEIREFYTSLKIRVGDLLDGLQRIRIHAYGKGGSPKTYTWEETLIKRIRKGTIARSDEYPIHDFFPAAVLDGDSSPRLLVGRHGFGRDDHSTPPLHFAVSIRHVSTRENYRAAFLMHDALTTFSERRRFMDNLARISASSIIHLFESPFSPNFRRLVKKGVKSWKIRPADFPPDGALFLSDDEALAVMDTEPRIHSIPPLLGAGQAELLFGALKRLRKSAVTDQNVAQVYSQIYNLYRFILTLPVPPDDYDEVANYKGYATINERLEDLKERTSRLSPVDYSVFDEAVQKIYSMVDRLRKDAARARGLLTEIRRARNKRLRVGIVIVNDIHGSAIERFLGRSLGTDPLALSSIGIEIISVRSLGYLKPDDILDVLLFTSYGGGGVLRWLMSGRGRETVVLATDEEQRWMLRNLHQGVDKTDTWRPRNISPPMPLEEKPEDKIANALAHVNPDLPTIPLEDEKFLESLLYYVPSRTQDASRISGPIKCRKISFQNHYAYLPVQGVVTVLTTTGTEEKAVTELRPGDTIIFVNESQTHTIYDLMLEEIRKSSQFSDYVIVIQRWHRRLQTWFSESALTCADVHQDLIDRGATVVSGTVVSWLRGNVMAPLDPKNLGRLFAIVGIEDPDGRIGKTVNEAAVRLRSVYRVFAKAVNAFLLRAAGEDRAEVDDLLEKYNLDITSIRDSVIKEQVVSVSDDIVSLSSSAKGRLYGK